MTPSVTSIVLVPGCRWIAEHYRALVAVLRVEPGRRLVVLDAVDDVPQFFQAYGRAVPVSDHQRPVLRGAHQLAAGLQGKARFGPMIVPVGRLTFQFLSAVSTSLIPICREAMRVRIYLDVDGVFLRASTWTCATPVTMEIRCAIRVSAYSSSVHSGIVGEVNAR